MAISKEQMKDMYVKMRRIRDFESTAARLFAEGKIPGFVHLYLGEEAIAPAVCECLRDDDFITSTHRGHGHIIAKGGDTISIDYDAGTVTVNGELLQEDYIAAPTYLGYDVQFPFTVPEGTLFVMGDNRNESLDSRSSYVGCIDERDILGKVLLCFMPFTDFGVVK